MDTKVRNIIIGLAIILSLTTWKSFFCSSLIPEKTTSQTIYDYIQQYNSHKSKLNKTGMFFESLKMDEYKKILVGGFVYRKKYKFSIMDDSWDDTRNRTDISTKFPGLKNALEQIWGDSPCLAISYQREGIMIVSCHGSSYSLLAYSKLSGEELCKLLRKEEYCVYPEIPKGNSWVCKIDKYWYAIN